MTGFFYKFENMAMNNSIKNELISITRNRLIEESTERIKQCLIQYSTKELWYSTHNNHNSIGNIVVHLLGNITQYILSGIGSQIDNRTRDLEFSENKNLSAHKLIEQLDGLMIKVNQVLNTINDDDLLKTQRVQCFDMTTVDILIHVIEHCSYHTGQIVYYTKYLKNIDTRFYKDMNL